MEAELKTQEKELSDDITNLNKKVEFRAFGLSFVVSTISQSKYLEKQFNDAQSQLRDIVRFQLNLLSLQLNSIFP